MSRSPDVEERVDRPDRFAGARAVADAVLYEGNVLYPYRASARKNRLRWQFGVLAPEAYVAQDASERSGMRAEIPVETAGRAPARLLVRLRCLQLRERVVEVAAPGGSYGAVPTLEVAGDLLTSFDESLEREVEIGPLRLSGLLGGAVATEPFSFEGGESVVAVPGAENARLVRRQCRVNGRITVRTEDLGGDLAIVSVTAENLTPWRGPATSRDDVMRHCLVGSHLLVAVEGGSFVSLLDPPEHARRAAASCTSVGCFPVLVGPPERSDTVLASPIILYDRPEVAPESPGDMCDATEIDEILALRTLTLTAAEKREARATDKRAAAILDRVDAFEPEVFERLHGAMRSLRPAAVLDGEAFPPAGSGADADVPWWDPGVDASVDPTSDVVTIAGQPVGRGCHVRLRPGPGGDAQDIFLAGRMATVGGVFRDVDGGVHLAVTLDDDPAAELHEAYGRYRYFRPEEIELAGGEAP